MVQINVCQSYVTKEWVCINIFPIGLYYSLLGLTLSIIYAQGYIHTTSLVPTQSVLPLHLRFSFLPLLILFSSWSHTYQLHLLPWIFPRVLPPGHRNFKGAQTSLLTIYLNILAPGSPLSPLVVIFCSISKSSTLPVQWWRLHQPIVGWCWITLYFVPVCGPVNPDHESGAHFSL